MEENRHRREGRGAPGKAIVLGGHYGALSVARALGREGIGVTVVAADRHDHACHSRFVSEVVVAPNPADDSAGLLATLMAADQSLDGALLVPTLDEYVMFVSQNRGDLGQRYAFAVPSWDVVERIINKNLLYAAAREAGVPTPDFFVPDSVSSLGVWRDAIHYPCILKPYESRRFSEIYGAKVLVARTFEELTREFTHTQENRLSVMVCEIVPGEDTSIFTYHCCIGNGGELLAELCSQKLRQYPAGFGQGSVMRTIPMVAEIRAHALKLLAAAGYRGESSTEFKLDCRDNRYKLMDINARPETNEWLAVGAGINLPLITYQDVVAGIRLTPQAYDTELHWINNHWEVVNFLRALREGHLDVREYFRAYGRRRVYAVPFCDDPLHFLRELRQNGGIALNKVRAGSPS